MIKQILGALALVTVLATAAQAADAPAAPAAAAPAAASEKCYGVAKAGKDVAVELPVGVCEKLANGSLVAPPADAMKPVEKK
jgi:uncharacterized membrane protein